MGKILLCDDEDSLCRSLGRILRAAGHEVVAMDGIRGYARLKEEPRKFPQAKQMLANLLGDHEALIRTLRADLQTALDKHGDAGTSDFLTGLMEKHEKMAWMLRSFLG